MKKIYQFHLLVILTVLATGSFAAELKISKTLDWKYPSATTTISEGLPIFTGFGIRDYAETLPVFIWQLADIMPQTTANARVENIVLMEPLPGVTLSPEDSALVPDHVNPIITRSIDRGTHSLEIGFIPIVKTADGKIFLIRSFDLIIDTQDDGQGLKQASGIIWKEQSKLATGTWYRLMISSDGIYKITYNDLVVWGIDPSGIDPARIGLYGNGGAIIPEANKASFPDDLLSVGIEISGGEDGSFDQGDYIRFWANGPQRWTYNTSSKKFKQNKNPYATEVPYFLNIDDEAPSRVTIKNNVTNDPTHIVSTFPDFYYFKPDSLSVSRTGRTWVSKQLFRSTEPRQFNLNFPNTVLTSAATIEISVAGWSNTASNFYAGVNGSQLIKTVIKGLNGNDLFYFTGVPATKAQGFFPSSDNINVSIWYDMAGSSPVGYLDYFSLQVTRKLQYTNNQMPVFYSPERESLKIPEVVFSNLTGSQHIWDVTQSDSTYNCNYVFDNELNTGRIRMNTTALHRFVVFEGGDEYTPEFNQPVPNQNLHALQPVDYIIITPDSLISEAERLAGLHHNYSNLSCRVIPIEQVINEFGGGIADPMAIRGFMRMLYDRGLSQGNAPKYLLLFGDGSYDPLNRIPNNQNLIPAYESLESFNLGTSYVTDDFFGLLDEGEGDSANGTLDLGIGRFPVSTIKQSKEVVDKIEFYLTQQPKSFGDWRNRFTFIADDEDSNAHIDQSHKLALAIDTLLPGQVINKVYLDAYVQTSTPSGNRYPEAQSALNQYVNDGCQVVNYTGHGGELGWSEEKVLEIPDIEAWDNYNGLPLFITATCEFSRFDDPGLLSAGERVLLNPNGGGIGLITTTRLAYSTINFYLNESLYQIWFANSKPRDYTFGDLIRLSKNANKNDSRMRNITLLGDPALRPDFPVNRIRITTVNETPINNFQSTLKALSEITVEGEVISPSASLLGNFNGVLAYRLYDKPMNTTTLVNDPKSKPFTFPVTNQQLIQGRATVENGKFRFTFIAPRDMQMAGGYPLLSLYATDSTDDATGHEKRLFFEGSDPQGLADDQPPVIQAWLDDRSFRNGDKVNQTPLLIADISDNLGVNFAGLGFGHDITAVIDNLSSATIVLNSYFQPTLDNPRSGSLSIMLPTLSSGVHTLVLRAFDINNNAASLTLSFYIGESTSEISFSDISVRPNPFTETTTIWFSLNNNNNDLTATLQIYDLSGRLVYLNTTTPEANTGKMVSITWDGKNNSNALVPYGVYPARIILIDKEGNSVSAGFKLIKAVTP